LIEQTSVLRVFFQWPFGAIFMTYMDVGNGSHVGLAIVPDTASIPYVPVSQSNGYPFLDRD
jgi:hypothetical protein